jgi:hypothetical protein
MGDSMSLDFGDFACAARESEQTRALRMALLYGELLRIPKSVEMLRILSGCAWVSAGGRDFVLGCGESLSLSGSSRDAIISAVHGETLFFEAM